MNKLALSLVALAALALIGAGAVYLWFTSDPAGAPSPVVRPPNVASGNAPARPDAPALDEAAAPRAADASDRSAVAARSEDRAALAFDRDAARWVEGRLEIPAGAPADPTLSVLVLAEPAGPRGLYGSQHAGPHATRTTWQPDGLLERAPVDASGRFRVPVPSGREAVWVAVDGRALYSSAAERVTPETSGLVLRPSLGGWIAGTVVLPRELLASAADAYTALDVTAGPDGSQFSTFAIDGTWLFEREVLVDSDGRFEIRALPTDRMQALRIESRIAATWTRRGVPLAPGGAVELEARLVSGASVTGRIVDPQGRAVGGAIVEANESAGMPFGREEVASGVADAEGRFELEHVTPGRLLLVARQEGYLDSKGTSIELQDRERREGVELALERGNVLAGRVVWPDGTPAVGARIDVDFDMQALMTGAAFNAARGADGEAETDGDGRFEVSGLGKGPFALEAKIERRTSRADGVAHGAEEGARASWRAERRGLAPNERDLELELAPVPTLVGRVVDGASEPVRAFSVTASQSNDGPWQLGANEKDEFESEDGTFALGDLGEGRWQVEVRAEGFGPTVLEDVMLPQREGEELLVVLAPSAAVQGVVLDPRGAPLGGARVSLHVEGGQMMRRLTGRLEVPETRSDAEGSFALADLSAGPQTLVATHPEYAESEAVTVDVTAGRATADVVLRLREGGTLTGEAYGNDGQRLAGAQVILQDPTTFESQGLRTDGAGAFAREHLRPGTWQVIVMVGSTTPDGEEGEEGEGMSAFMDNMRFTMAEVRDGETTHVVLGAPPEDPVRVHGRVSHDGEPVTGVVVSFMPSGGKGFESMKFTQVDQQGEYEVQLDAPGDFLVQVQALGGEDAPMQQQNVEFAETIPQAEEHRLDLALPGGRISGRVLGADGKAGSGTRVTLTIDGGIAYGTFMGGQYAESMTRTDGTFDFEFLRAGTYSVAAGGTLAGGAFGGAGSNGRVVKRDIRVGEGEHREGVDFRLQGAGTVVGTVLDDAGKPVQGASIFVRDADGNLMERFSMNASGPDGKFEYTGLAPGTYTVEARWHGLASPDGVRVRVEAGEPAEATVRLAPGTMLVVAVVGEDDERVRATVSVLDARDRQVNGMLGFAEIMDRMQGGFASDEQVVGPLPAGSYTVVVVADDGRRTTKPVTLSGQAERKLKIRLRD